MRREQNQAAWDGNGYGIRLEVRAHLLLFTRLRRGELPDSQQVPAL